MASQIQFGRVCKGAGRGAELAVWFFFRSIGQSGPVGRRLIAEQVEIGMHSAALGRPLAHELPKVLAPHRDIDAAQRSNQLVPLARLGERLLAAHRRLMPVRHPACQA